MKKHTLVVTGGGSGGHLFPGFAIAEEWKTLYPNSRVFFIGAKAGIESKLLPKSPYPHALLSLSALKSVTPVQRTLALIKIPFAVLNSAFLLFRERPEVVMGVGGYASGPVVLVARLLGWGWGCKVAILEQNAIPGFTNRVLGKFAHQIFCAFPGIDRQFNPKKTVIAGNPLRKEIVDLPPASRTPFTVFVFGGSQGAMGINSLVLEALPLLSDLKSEIEFIHQTGEKDFERVVAGYKSAGWGARIEKFIYDMSACYAKASLVICRGGASSFAELAATGRASILIPLPTSADNHQEKNAKLFSEAGATIALYQRQAKGADLEHEIRRLIKEPTRLNELESAVRRFHRPDAAKSIVSALARAP